MIVRMDDGSIYYGECPLCNETCTSANAARLQDGSIKHIACAAAIRAAAAVAFPPPPAPLTPAQLDRVAAAIGVPTRFIAPVRKPLPPLPARRPAPVVAELTARLVTEAPAEEAPQEEVRDNRTAKSGGKSKGNDRYLTPADFLAAVRAFAPIALDPSGSDGGSLVGAAREYCPGRGEDGLALSWIVPLGTQWYDNPPYSGTRKWIEKADAEYAAHHSEGTMLIAARTETIAVQAAKARCICFIKGRLTFLDPDTKEPPKDAKGKDTAAMFPSMVLYYGIREARFRELFAPWGKVVRWT